LASNSKRQGQRQHLGLAGAVVAAQQQVAVAEPEFLAVVVEQLDQPRRSGCQRARGVRAAGRTSADGGAGVNRGVGHASNSVSVGQGGGGVAAHLGLAERQIGHGGQGIARVALRRASRPSWQPLQRDCASSAPRRVRAPTCASSGQGLARPQKCAASSRACRATARARPGTRPPAGWRALRCLRPASPRRSAAVSSTSASPSARCSAPGRWLRTGALAMVPRWLTK
jgi:hypothetical protein